MDIGRLARLGGLAIILAVAIGVRLHDIGFGLPSLYDPDEPIFMVLSLNLLKNQTLNPGWFGHPGTTTIYLVALIDLGVLAFGLATHRFASVGGFAAAAYAHPGMLFVPARVAMALFGVGCVWLTYTIGRRAFGETAALVGSALLAINSLHVMWSQVIRTDVMASFFMLASLLFAIRAQKRGRLKDYMISGALVGIATATKWPSAIVAIGLVGVAVHRSVAERQGYRVESRNVAAAFACALIALFLSSPYIFFDWRTVLANVTGEMTPRHLAQTGGSFFYNLRWYMLGQVAPSMGVLGLLVAIAGAVLAFWRNSIARCTLVPVGIAFLALICSQSLVWSRWLIPEMPLLCLFAGAAVEAIAMALAAAIAPRPAKLLTGAVALVIALPSVASVHDKIRERAVDTRALAAQWASEHIPPGSTVVLENLELRLRDRPWHFRFPFGRAGCIDGLQALTKGVGYKQLQTARGGSPIVDIGNVSPAALDSCRGDFAILTYYDLYLAEASHFPNQVRNYQRLLRDGRTVALFRPLPGEVGGPVVRVVSFPQQ